MNDLSPRTKAALAVYRDTPALDEEARDRLWSRLEASVAAEAEPAPVVRLDVPRTALRMGIALAAAAAILLLLRAIDWQSLTGSKDEDPRSQAVYGAKEEPEGGVAKERVEQTARTPRPQSVPRTTAPEPEQESSPEVEAPVHGDPAPKTPDRPSRPTSPPEAKAPPVDTLMEEMRLMARVQSALDEGDATKALAALDAHARQHPHGQMAEDRAAFRPQALCAAGRNEPAVAAARRFLDTHRKSAHRSRVQAVADAAAQKKCPTP